MQLHSTFVFIDKCIQSVRSSIPLSPIPAQGAFLPDHLIPLEWHLQHPQTKFMLVSFGPKNADIR